MRALEHTVARPVTYHDLGLFTGEPVAMTIHPAAAGTGIVLVRTDLPGSPEVPAQWGRVTDARRRTMMLGVGNGASIWTVEHLLAAFVGLGIDNVVVELNSPEVPIMDGSAAPFVYLIQEAGVKTLPAARRYLKVLRPVSLTSGEKRIALYPSDHCKVTYSIAFDHPLLRYQARTLRITEDTFVDDIAPARTFGFLKEVEMLRRRGLALGGSLENAVVVGDTGVLNNALRFEDEFVRHKILDLLGDMALVGYPISGHLVAHRGGHALHTEFAARVLKEADAWTLVEGTTAAAEVASAALPVNEAS